MSFPYTTGIPNPPDNPSSDVSNMQTNTNTINSWVAVDHIGFNNAAGGLHKQVSFAINQASLPTLASSVGGLFANGANLTYQNSAVAGQGIFQLTSFTGTHSSQYAISGTDFCLVTPWGFVISWGYVNATVGGQAVTFAISPASGGYTNATISVLLTPLNNLATTKVTGVTTSGFTATSSVNTQCSYFAIGF